MLLDAIPDIHMSGRARTPVQGEVPNPLNPPTGCAFHPRCPHANARCSQERPVLRLSGHPRGLPRGGGRPDLTPGQPSRRSPANRSATRSRSRISTGSPSTIITSAARGRVL
jgi:hypothetical protein